MRLLSPLSLLTLLCVLLHLPATALADSSRPPLSIAANESSVRPLLNGQTVPANLPLKNSQGQAVNLSTLLQQKPAVLVFFRGGWCPFCNTQLAGLREILPKLEQLGYQLIAISPQSAPDSRQTEQKVDQQPLNFTLYSDESLSVSSAFGLAYYMNADTEKLYRNSYGIKLTYDQTGQAVLPVPAVFIVNRHADVLFSYVHLNYKVRLQPALLLHAAELFNQTE